MLLLLAILNIGRLRYPCRSFSAYYRRVTGCFGTKFVWMLFSAYFGVKGFLYTMLVTGQLPYFRSYEHVSGSSYQAYGTVAMTPWSMKALFGAISDALPIKGYHKRPYIVGAAAVGTASLALLAAVKIGRSAAGLAAILFFFCHLELSVVDLLCEGKYAEMMVEKPHTSTDLVTWVWGTYQLGCLLASCLVGPLADKGFIRGMFWICLPFAAQILLPALRGWLPETPVRAARAGAHAAARCCKPVWGKVLRHWRTFVLAVAMAVCALTLAVLNVQFKETPGVILGYCIGASVVLCAMSFWALPRMLAKCNVYMFLASATYLQIAGAVDYFYTAQADCIEDGPHFSYTYYTTWSSIVQSVFGAVGVSLFQIVMSKWKFRTVFWSTTLLRVSASVVDIVIVKRWNVNKLGVSDKAMFMLGYNIVYSVSYMMEFMPAVILTSKLCPKNMESTMYALLAGFQNLGQGIARSMGLFGIAWFGVKTPAEPTLADPCNFEGLSSLVMMSHMLFPLVTIPLTFCLIPNALLTDDLKPRMPADDGSAGGESDEVGLLATELVAVGGALGGGGGGGGRGGDGQPGTPRGSFCAMPSPHEEEGGGKGGADDLPVAQAVAVI